MKSVVIAFLLVSLSQEVVADSLSVQTGNALDKLGKVTKTDSARFCFESKNICPISMREWVDDDQSLGLLPSYKQLSICEDSAALKKMSSAKEILDIVPKMAPEINTDAIDSIANCSQGGVEATRRTIFKSIYFLKRINQTVQKNVTQVAALDKYLQDDSLAIAKIDCYNPQFSSLQKYCSEAQNCPASTQEQKNQFVTEVSKIEVENQALDKSIQILENQISTKMFGITNQIVYSQSDRDRIKKGSEEVKDLESKKALLVALKEQNLSRYPILNDQTFQDEREDGVPVSDSIRKAYLKKRDQLVQDTNQLLEKSLCTISSNSDGCSPSDLNKTLQRTDEFSGYNYQQQKTFPAFADGVAQQDCIATNVQDRKEVSKNLAKDFLQAGIDIGLVLIPGTATIVIARRVGMAAKAGMDIASAASKVSKVAEVLDATVNVSWMSYDSVQALKTCQEEPAPVQRVSGDQCSAVSSLLFPNPDLQKSDCEKAVLFAAMSGLPIAGQALTYSKRVSVLSEVSTEAKKAIQTASEEALKKEEFKSIDLANPQIQIWRTSGEAANLERGQKIEELVKTELSTGKVIENKIVTTSYGKPIGNNGAINLKYESGLEGIWKGKAPSNSPESDIAAYIVDRHLKSNRVPVTIEKTINGVKGAVQLKVNALKESKSLEPEDLKLVDYLNGNSDRHVVGNHVESADGQSVAIDNGRAFFLQNDPKARYVQNPIDPLLKDIELAESRVKMAKDRLEPFTKGTASEVYRREYSESELKAALKEQEAALEKIKMKSKSSISNMLPSKEFISILKKTKKEDWDQLLGKLLSQEQIAELIQRQNKIIQSYEKAAQKLNL